MSDGVESDRRAHRRRAGVLTALAARMARPTISGMPLKACPSRHAPQGMPLKACPSRRPQRGRPFQPVLLRRASPCVTCLARCIAEDPCAGH